MGQFLIFKAFALVIIGGLGNIPGAIAAAIGLGLIESWIGGFFEIAWQEAAVFVTIIVVLFLRPEACSSAAVCGSDEALRRLARGAGFRRACRSSRRRTTSSAWRISALIFRSRPRRSTWSTAIRAFCRSPVGFGASAVTPRRSRS